MAKRTNDDICRPCGQRPRLLGCQYALVYHFGPHPKFGPACNALIARIENQELRGITSTHVVSEVAHKLMTAEASLRFGWSSKVVGRLKRDPTRMQTLTTFCQAVAQIPQLGIQILTIPDTVAVSAPLVSQKFGLLSNDAVLVAVMQQQGVSNLASLDADFDRVPGLTRYAPICCWPSASLFCYRGDPQPAARPLNDGWRSRSPNTKRWLRGKRLVWWHDHNTKS